MACSPDEYPEELWTKDRPTLAIVPLTEVLYRSVAVGDVDDDGEVLPSAFSLGWPECSVNGSFAARPEHCVYPHPDFEGRGAAEISVADVPEIFKEPNVPDIHETGVRHSPRECNYSHCDIFVIKAGKILGAKDNCSRTMKSLIRRRLADLSRVVLPPQR